MKQFSQLAISNPDELIFGIAPKPVTTRNGLVIGGGAVLPELNFTLPPIKIEQQTMPEVLEHYREMITDALKRAVALHPPGLIVEFETLPPMTQNPQWATDICNLLLEKMHEVESKHGLKSVLRITPNDTRGWLRPPRMRSGHEWDAMLDTFAACAAAGAELLSIESLGGKEVCDEALTYGDLPGVIFALCVMGVRDMQFLWTHLVELARTHGVKCAGDTACGFANTAMVLAEQRMIPRVFAAVVRSVSAVRSLVAFECGAVGPGKDCAYENIILKVITGCPMSHEGKSATCAHLSAVGNVAAVACDAWSNESVQNVRLLGGNAPTCYLETLIYDCRLMNEALADGLGAARTLRNWLARSDAPHDPQALVLTAESAVRIAQAIVDAQDHYHAGVAAARTTIELIRQAHQEGKLQLAKNELPWLDRMEKALDKLPDDTDEFISQQMQRVDKSKFVPEDYDLVA